MSVCLDTPLFRAEPLRSRAEAVLSSLPRGGEARVGFEVHLGGPDPGALDIFLGFASSEPRPLARMARSLPGSRGAGGHTPSLGLARMAEAWAGDPEARERVHHLWLEWDRPEPTAPWGGVPGVFLGRDAPLPSAWDPAAWLTDRCREMEAVSGSAVPEPVVDAALRVFDSVPDEGGPSSVGYFPGRHAEAVRVCVGGLDITGTAVALWKLGLVGDPRPVQEALLGCRSPGDGILAEVGLLHLDVGEALGRRTGVELVFSLPRQLSGASSMPLFDHLESLGLAEPGLCRAVRSWPGETRVGDHPAFRILNHVKVVLVDGGIVEAKAYVGIRVGFPEMMAQEAR